MDIIGRGSESEACMMEHRGKAETNQTVPDTKQQKDCCGNGGKMSEKQPKKKKTAGDIVLTVVLIAAVCVFCYAGYNLFHIYTEYKKGTDEYNSIAQMAADPFKYINDRFGKWILKYTIYKYIKYKISDTCNDQTDSQCL